MDATYVVLKTRDFRGTLGLRHVGDVLTITDPCVASELTKKGFIALLGSSDVPIAPTESDSEKSAKDMEKQEIVAELIERHGFNPPDNWSKSRLQDKLAELRKENKGGDS